MTNDEYNVIVHQLRAARPDDNEEHLFHVQWNIDCQHIGDALASIQPPQFNHADFLKAVGAQP